MELIVSPLTLGCQVPDAEICQHSRVSKIPPADIDVLAKNAKTAREREFRTPLAAAKAIGCSRTLIVAWEKGDSAIRDSGYQGDAAKAYRVRLDWLKDNSGPDGYPLDEPEVLNAPTAPAHHQTTDNDTLKGSLNELQGVLTAVARVMAGTRLDVASAMEVELKALPTGPYLEILLGVVEREHAKLKRSSPKTRDSKGPGSKKHSHA